MVIPNDFGTLVNYFSFSMWVFHFGTCAALLYFRWERPNAKRPIKVLKFRIELINNYKFKILIYTTNFT